MFTSSCAVQLPNATALPRVDPGSTNQVVRTHGTAALITALAMLVPTSADATDGCQVLLCLAAPSWRAVPQCVPPVKQVLHDLARGKPFPTCHMAGSGNSAVNDWAAAPAFCPPQYTRLVHSESGPIHLCDYNGAITVHVGGALFTRTWWTMDGDAVTEFSPAAKVQLGTWDGRFDEEYMAWLATLPQPAAPIDSGY